MSNLNKKIAVVTGGSRGIGKCIIDKFIADGIEKIYSLDLTKGDYSYDNVEQIEVSVTDREKLAEIVEKIKNEAGRIDILVNNAGVTKDGLLGKMDEKAWDFVIDINLKGVFNVTQAISPIMIEQGSGSIINISSVVGVYGNVGQTNYAATKSGVIGMTYTWAKEFTRKGAQVRTNAVAPGYIETEMVLSVPENILNKLREKTPMGRLGKPEEIANVVSFLASDEASYVNGHVLEVTGGLRL